MYYQQRLETRDGTLRDSFIRKAWCRLEDPAGVWRCIWGWDISVGSILSEPITRKATEVNTTTGECRPPTEQSTALMFSFLISAQPRSASKNACSLRPLPVLKLYSRRGSFAQINLVSGTEASHSGVAGISKCQSCS